MAELQQCGLILLAAGGSERMGQPKQLLPVDGKPLIRHMAELALNTHCHPVVVVLGGAAEQIRPCLDGLDVCVATNSAWRQGLSSSLRSGIECALRKAPDLAAITVVLADQPHVSPDHLNQLLERFARKDCTVVASETEGRKVPPILFSRRWFAKLCALQGDRGAKDLLNECPNEIATVPLKTNADLDTREDYERFLRNRSSA